MFEAAAEAIMLLHVLYMDTFHYRMSRWQRTCSPTPVVLIDHGKGGKKRIYKSIPKPYHYISEYNSYKVTMKSKLEMKPVPRGSEICIREIKTKRNPISCLRRKNACAYVYFIFSECSVEYSTLFHFPNVSLKFKWHLTLFNMESSCSWSNKFNVFKWKYVIKLTRKKTSNIF